MIFSADGFEEGPPQSHTSCSDSVTGTIPEKLEVTEGEQNISLPPLAAAETPCEHLDETLDPVQAVDEMIHSEKVVMFTDGGSCPHSEEIRNLFANKNQKVTEVRLDIHPDGSILKLELQQRCLPVPCVFVRGVFYTNVMEMEQAGSLAPLLIAHRPVEIEKCALERLLESEGNRLLLLDIRTTEETSQGIIPNAKCIPWQGDRKLAQQFQLSSAVYKKTMSFPKPRLTDPVVVYDRNQQRGAATKACAVMDSLGYGTVYIYNGGWDDWCAAASLDTKLEETFSSAITHDGSPTYEKKNKYKKAPPPPPPPSRFWGTDPNVTRVWIEKKGEEVEALAPKKQKGTKGESINSEPPRDMSDEDKQVTQAEGVSDTPPPKSTRVQREGRRPPPRLTWVSYGPPPPRTKQSDTTRKSSTTGNAYIRVGARFLRKNPKVITALEPLSNEVIRAHGNENMRRGNAAVLPLCEVFTGPSSIDDKLSFLNDFARMQMMKRKKKRVVIPEEQTPNTNQRNICTLRKVLMENTSADLQNAVFQEVRNLCKTQTKFMPQRPQAPRGPAMTTQARQRHAKEEEESMKKESR